MSTTLVERAEIAVARATESCARSQRLVSGSQRSRLASKQVRARSVASRQALRPSSVAWFSVEGTVDGQPRIARWRRGELACDDELRRRIDIVVALEERFPRPDGRAGAVTATLCGSSVAAMLTVMRAFSRVRAVEFGTGAPAPDQAS
jgi:hypothetical protein